MSEKFSNLLVVMSDEHRRDAMGCMGHPIVQTPNLDALALRGSVFENSYTPCPMCVPARAAAACGDYVHNIRYWDSATPYDGRRRSWMHELRDKGIDVASIGKLHFRSSEDDNGFSEELLPMHVVGGVGWAAGLLRENPPLFESAAELARDVGSGASAYTDYDLEITEVAEKWLHDGKRKQRPWAAFVSLVSPHYPLTAPEKWYGLYDPDDMDPPVAYETGKRPNHPEIRHIVNLFDYDQYFDPQRAREAKAAYYGLTSFMDDCLGRVLAALETSGQADNTLVIYTSDHGDMLGDHGMWTKQVMYEASAGIPMIMAGPGVDAGRRVATGASLLDLAATALDNFGLPENAGLPGKSLLKISAEPDEIDRTVLSEYHDGGSTTGTFMIRWRNWKLVYYHNFKPQLFNLEIDPHEQFDLVENAETDSEVVAALAEGAKRLNAICDPSEVNRLAFSDQKKRIEELGGLDACINAYIFNHTPTPREQKRMREGPAL
ncbi:MAG: sulfatase-like hydrolase/transferase [Roseovarius sp.]|nr:sulfatase-like hydrolase/transferase [Roseovarius sp.]